MAKIFISFLGIGNLYAKPDQPGYDILTYRFENDPKEYRTLFAQRAIIEKHGASSFDRICLMMTPESRNKHRDLLVKELLSIGCTDEKIIQDDSITTNQNTEQQWEWFDSLQKLIQDDDEVIFDFTHGFRSVPIIFSTAISFLQKVKHFTLLNAYYGYMINKLEATGEIIDMAKFYRINEWADGVSRLVDTADASKLAALAEEGKDDGFAALNDPKLVKALRDLTDLIKNIDVNNVAKKADEALNLIQQKRKQCSGADEQLLKMVVEKFENLAITTNGSYDMNYFKLQLLLAEMLLKHELYMQAFTVMRECVGSLVMLKSKSFSREYKNRNQARLRYILSDIFISLFTASLENSRHKNKNEFSSIVMPFYDELRQLPGSPIPILESFVIELTDLRNGFNHAWVSKNGVPSNLDKKGKDFLTKLNKVIETLSENRLL